MARGKPGSRAARLHREACSQDELFEKSHAEELEARRGEPIECLGLTFENDEARRTHYLGRLKEGLEELHAKLGGVAFADADDAAARMTAVEHWPMGNETQLRGLAERMRRADPSKDLLQRWKDEVGFPHGEGSRPSSSRRLRGYRSWLASPAFTCQFFYRTRTTSRRTLSGPGLASALRPTARGLHRANRAVPSPF